MGFCRKGERRRAWRGTHSTHEESISPTQLFDLLAPSH